MLLRTCVSRTALLVVIGLAAALGLPVAPAHAGCGAIAGEDLVLYTVIAPPVTNFQASGEAPLSVTVRIEDGVVVVPATGEISIRGAFDWGDGSAQEAIRAESCGDETAYWPAQTFTHVFTTPRAQPYEVFIHVTLSAPSLPSGGQSFPLPVVFVTVTAASATPVPTPAPTAAATPATTASQEATAPRATEPAAQPTRESTSVPAAGAASIVPASPSPGSTPTATPTRRPATATPAVSATANASVTAGPVLGAPPPPPPAGPIEVIESIKAPDQISTDPEVMATNLVLAGVTVWVLFSSVMLNQVLQGNRAEIDRRTARLASPVRRARQALASRWSDGTGGWLGAVGSAAFVLTITALIYTVLDPGVGWNRPTFTLLVSVIVGIGVVTYVASGLEAAMTRRVGDLAAAVRPYPAAIAIAAASVAISRALDFRPGVMYGFVASCALLAPTEPDGRKAGRIAFFPTAAILVLSVGAWALLGPLRSWRSSSGAWPAEALEAAAVVVFVGGIEALFIGMIPLSVMDGGKIFRWSRPIWLGFTLVSAFLVWHVLIGRERASFSGLREASSVTVLLLFMVYTVLTVGFWAYFRFHRPPLEP